jgi:hypothetical protein
VERFGEVVERMRTSVNLSMYKLEGKEPLAIIGVNNERDCAW